MSYYGYVGRKQKPSPSLLGRFQISYNADSKLLRGHYELNLHFFKVLSNCCVAKKITLF